jgi:hypothetical protein
MHMNTPALEMIWPATPTETDSELAMSLSVPGTTMTPVPMTTLPHINAHSTRLRVLASRLRGGVLGMERIVAMRRGAHSRARDGARCGLTVLCAVGDTDWPR